MASLQVQTHDQRDDKEESTPTLWSTSCADESSWDSLYSQRRKEAEEKARGYGLECAKNNEALLAQYPNYGKPIVSPAPAPALGPDGKPRSPGDLAYLYGKNFRPFARQVEKYKFVRVATKLMRDGGVWAEFWKMRLTDDCIAGCHQLIIDAIDEYGQQPMFMVLPFKLKNLDPKHGNVMAVMCLESATFVNGTGNDVIAEVSQFRVHTDSSVQYLGRPLLKGNGFEIMDKVFLSQRNFSGEPLQLRKHLFNIALMCNGLFPKAGKAEEPKAGKAEEPEAGKAEEPEHPKPGKAVAEEEHDNKEPETEPKPKAPAEPTTQAAKEEEVAAE